MGGMTRSSTSYTFKKNISRTLVTNLTDVAFFAVLNRICLLIIRQTILCFLCSDFLQLKPVCRMQEDSSRTPSYTVTCEDYVHVVEFSPFSSGTSASLLAYGGNQYVVVGTCLFQVRDTASIILVYQK